MTGSRAGHPALSGTHGRKSAPAAGIAKTTRAGTGDMIRCGTPHLYTERNLRP